MFAFRVNTVIQVYTGTFGLLYLPGIDGNNHPIYLYTEDSKEYLPAPKYFWKVLYNPESHTAVGFLGLNNPYVTESPKAKCESVCAQISFADWDVKDFDAGHMACCRVEDLRAEVENLPDLTNDACCVTNFDCK